jgi:hypothetical protein
LLLVAVCIAAGCSTTKPKSGLETARENLLYRSAANDQRRVESVWLENKLYFEGSSPQLASSALIRLPSVLKSMARPARQTVLIKVSAAPLCEERGKRVAALVRASGFDPQEVAIATQLDRRRICAASGSPCFDRADGIEIEVVTPLESITN